MSKIVKVEEAWTDGLVALILATDGSYTPYVEAKSLLESLSRANVLSPRLEIDISSATLALAQEKLRQANEALRVRANPRARRA